MKTFSEEKKCDDKNISFNFDENESQIFQNGSIFPKTLPVTFLNYMTQRKEENEKYNFPDLTKFSFPNFAQDAYEIAGAV